MKQPRFSDHAVLRYIERVYGVDIEGLRRELFTPMLKEACRIGASGLVDNGIEYKIEDGVVVTVWVRKYKGKDVPGRVRENGVDEDVGYDDGKPDTRKVEAG